MRSRAPSNPQRIGLDFADKKVTLPQCNAACFRCGEAPFK